MKYEGEFYSALDVQSFPAACFEACAIAAERNVVVYFDYLGTVIHANPGDEPAAVMAEWVSKRQTRWPELA